MTTKEKNKELANVTLCHFFKDYESILLPIILKKFNISILDVLDIDEVYDKYWGQGYIEDGCVEWLSDDVLDSMESGDINSTDLDAYIYGHEKELQKEVIEYLEENADVDL